MKGYLEKDGAKWVVYTIGHGYLGVQGGFSRSRENAKRFEGAGFAIRAAQAEKVAIIGYDA